MIKACSSPLARLPNLSKSAEKGLGYYEEHEAVIFTPNADLDLTARVKITNKDFGFSSDEIFDWLES
jgi:hypothetical protein